MGKKDIQQGDDENRGCCRQCLGFLKCCNLPAASGVKIVSIISILIGLVFCCLGVWTIIVTTNNNELALRNQVVYELNQPKSAYVSTGNGQPSLSVHNTVVSAGDLDTISTQSSLFDTASVYLTAPSASSSSSSASSSAQQQQQQGQGQGLQSSSWPLSSVSMGKGPSGRKPPTQVNHAGPKKLIPLGYYHNYLICLGILSISVGFIRSLASIFLLWNSVEKHSKTPGALWILLNVLGTVGLLVFLGVTLNVTGFINDFPWRPIAVHNDRFNFYLLLAMFRIVCICDIFLTFYFVLVVLWFVRTLH